MKINLFRIALNDFDVEIMLHDLPHLRHLSLGCKQGFPGLTDKTCEAIASKCPKLQVIDLSFHEKLTHAGIRRIFEGCVHLREFHSKTLQLKLKDVKRLLRIAPQLMCLDLDEKLFSTSKLVDIIESVGGRTLMFRSGRIFWDAKSLSPKTIEKYGSQMKLFQETIRN